MSKLNLLSAECTSCSPETSSLTVDGIAEMLKYAAQLSREELNNIVASHLDSDEPNSDLSEPQ